MANGVIVVRRRSLIGPVMLISLGLLFLLRNLGIPIPLGRLFLHYWPVLLIIWGLVRLLEYLHAQRRGYPVPRMSSGMVVLLIFWIILGVAASKSSHLNWNALGDEMNVDQNVLDFVGTPYTYTDQAEHPFADGQSVKLVSDHGDVKIHPGDPGKVKIVAHKKITAETEEEARRFNTSSTPTFSLANNVLTINANTNAHGSGIQFDSGIHVGPRIHSDLDVYLPPKAAVEIDTRHGDIVAEEREGDVKATSSYGDAELNNISGNVTLVMRHGSVKISHVKGNVALDGRVGDTDISDVTGAVTLSGDYPDSVKIANVNQAVKFHSTYTDLELAKLAGELYIDGSDLRAKSGDGPLNLTTHSKDIHLDEITGDIKVEDNNGEVEVHAKAPLGNVQVVNRKGLIRVWIPSNADFELDAKAIRGDIENDFNLSSTTSGGDSHAAGRVGGGGHKLLLSTEHANIEIHKATTETGEVLKIPFGSARSSADER